jgi:hypothetical protein
MLLGEGSRQEAEGALHQEFHTLGKAAFMDIKVGAVVWPGIFSFLGLGSKKQVAARDFSQEVAHILPSHAGAGVWGGG